MKNPRNLFKAALKSGQHQLGVWNSISGPVVTEILAGAGFDWVLVDTEHCPTEVTDVLPALQTIAGYPQVSGIVRPASNDVVLIKRILDLGAQTLLLPYIQSAAEAEAAVRAISYPPKGVRGVGGLMRASRFGQIDNYTALAEEELCLLVQVETAQAMQNLEAIASVEGVDGVFIGPADLAASMGHPGDFSHPDVINEIENAIRQLQALSVPSGILALDEAFAQRCIDLGTGFTAVGFDIALLTKAVHGVRSRF